ncbi:MAG: glycosyltransferase family 2 protein [Candidatus Parcubacteria bacterium]|nr:glycosyltransferase family 2 protein [Candidatus Parcubacteria bacterium]
MSKKIFVVIPYYNGREYLPDCFASLARQTLSPEKIIVIDNNSTDHSQDDLRQVEQKYSLVRVIYNKDNLGFVGACNQGIELAMKDGADYIFLLNQDTICDPRCLEQLLLAKESQPKIFAIQALLLCWPRQDLIQTSGDHIHFLGFGYSGDYKLKILNYKLKIQQVTYASGAAMFLSAEAIKEVGLFDQDLFLYHEDLDLCWRARLSGYQIILAPQAIVYHKYTEGVVKNRWYWSERNRLDGQFNFAGLNSPILKNIINPIFGAYWWIIKNIILW